MKKPKQNKPAPFLVSPLPNQHIQCLMLERLKFKENCWRVAGLFLWIVGKCLWRSGESLSLLESCVVGAGAVAGAGVSVLGAGVKALGRRVSAVGERWWTGGARLSRSGARRSRVECRVFSGLKETAFSPRRTGGGPETATLPRQAGVNKLRRVSKTGRKK
jgi:hypothetical protein